MSILYTATCACIAERCQALAYGGQEDNCSVLGVRVQIFTTVHNGQTELCVLIYAGESQKASKNRLLGQFQLINLPPAPVGEPQIEAIPFRPDLTMQYQLSAYSPGLHAATHAG